MFGWERVYPTWYEPTNEKIRRDYITQQKNKIIKIKQNKEKKRRKNENNEWKFKRENHLTENKPNTTKQNKTNQNHWCFTLLYNSFMF